MKRVKILFFIDGTKPTASDIEQAKAINGNVCFRNARHVPPEQHSLEVCDGVAGEVPEIYAKQFPGALAVIAEKEKASKALAEKVGDIPAPTINAPVQEKKPSPRKPATKKRDELPKAQWTDN